MDSRDCTQALSTGSRYLYALGHLAKTLQDISSENKMKVGESVTENRRGSVELNHTL